MILVNKIKNKLFWGINYSLNSVKYQFQNIFLLFNGRIKYFDSRVYSQKSVLIIGSADSAFTFLKDRSLDNFDLIVRINKGHLLLPNVNGQLGSRTNILYHCLDFNHLGGCGPINDTNLVNQELQYLIFPYTEGKFLRNLLTALKKTSFPVFRFKKVEQEKLHLFFSKTTFPTTGFRALFHILSSDFKELHITGFTFFRTPHAAGFNTINHKEILDVIKNSGNHDPELELQIFKELIKNHPKKNNIFLDDFLTRIINEDNF
jgi:hypothetical protein